MEDKSNEQRRIRLMQIVEGDFSGDNDAVVRAIKEATGQDVSVRSVQTWLIAPARASHRKAPEWVLNALEAYIKRPDKQAELERHALLAAQRKTRPLEPLAWADEVRSKRAVDLATSHAEAEDRERATWRKALGHAAGDAVFEAFRAQRRDFDYLTNVLSSIDGALHTASSFDEFKRTAQAAMQSKSLSAYHIRETRGALEKGEGEFSNADGIPSR